MSNTSITTGEDSLSPAPGRGRGRAGQVARAAAGLLVALVGGVVVYVGLDLLIQAYVAVGWVGWPGYKAALAQARGLGLATALCMATALWGIWPNLLRVQR